ncbi:MAG: hypothetical protein Q4G26_11925 [Paracoccus sp. (in: a-proteobacteria)]|nr:hypothetical protein [Paracoccus sp. (in: a-proteobacteria)]
MFAPVGYLPAIQVFERLCRLGNAEIRFTLASQQRMEHDGGDVSADDFLNIYTSRETFAEWAIWRLLCEQSLQPYLANSSGQTFVASSFFFEGHLASSVETFCPMQPSPDLEKWFIVWRSFGDNPDSVRPPWDRVPFINQDTWSVRPVGDARSRLNELGMTNWFPGWERLIQDLAGCVVCFRKDDMPDDDELLGMLEDLGADITIKLASNARKPALRTAARAAFQRLYPDGRNGQTWKEVARAVGGEVGRPVSVKTLVRAVSEGQATDS